MPLLPCPASHDPMLKFQEATHLTDQTLSDGPACAQGGVDLGRIASLEKDHKPVDTARRGDAVAMKIEVRPHRRSRIETL